MPLLTFALCSLCLSAAGTGKPVSVRTRTFDSVDLDLAEDS